MEEFLPDSWHDDALNMTLLHLRASFKDGTDACDFLECCCLTSSSFCCCCIAPSLLHRMQMQPSPEPPCLLSGTRVCFGSFFFFFQHLSLQNRPDPPSLLRAADLSRSRSFNTLTTNTANITESRPRHCDEGRAPPLHHTSTPVNLLIGAIYNIHPCGWLTSQNSIFPEKQLHDVVVSVMFWAVTD